MSSIDSNHPPDDSPVNSEDTGTSIDLGDDLLDPTLSDTIAKQKTSAKVDEKKARQQAAEAVDEQYQSAEILINEGLLEDAKKILRKLIRCDPHFLPAKKKLEEIHEAELKQIFGEQTGPNVPLGDYGIQGRDASHIVEQLDRDLDLGLESAQNPGMKGSAGYSAAVGPQAAKWVAALLKSLDQQMAGTTRRDRLDMGIAFLEMGLYPVAAALFESVMGLPKPDANRTEILECMSAFALAAYTYIVQGRPFKAVPVLEKVLIDTEFQFEDKVEFFYLMGRAHELLENKELAIGWLHQVIEVDPFYRDAYERLRNLQE